MLIDLTYKSSEKIIKVISLQVKRYGMCHTVHSGRVPNWYVIYKQT